MTIAACYVSPEGVIFGADSTSSVVAPGGLHYLNHNQKVFEVGQNGTLGMITWGLGGIGEKSYRTLLALLADSFEKTPCKNVLEVMNKWTDLVWHEYSTSPFLKPLIDQCKALSQKPAYNPLPTPAAPAVATSTPPIAATPTPIARTQEEEELFDELRWGLAAGFCIGGYILPDRTPLAYEILIDPLASKPTPTPVVCNSCTFRGAPNMVLRLLNGYDPSIPQTVINSGKWTGTPQELNQILSQFKLQYPALPIRDAIDFVHISIYSTIKAMKFSNLSQICGGPIELAVITTDRNFRWVWHKDWDAAILEGDHK